MTSERSAVQHYLGPTMFLAYGWAWAFTAFAAAVALKASHLWPAFLTLPAVVFGFAALFAIVAGLRPLLLDLTTNLGLREKMGVFLAHALLFMAPKLISPKATLVDCLIALQLPLVVFLVRRENFLRLYAVNFLLVALAVFLDWQTQKSGFLWAACVPIFLAGCFAADRFFFEIDRYPSAATRPFGRPLFLAAKFAAISLAGGGVLYALTPELAFAGPRRRAAGEVVVRPGIREVSSEALLDLIWQTFVLLMLLVAALALLQWLKKKYGRKGEAEEVEMGGGVMRMVRKVVRQRPRPPQMPRGFSPREQIIRGYWSWCEEMERFGLARPPAATPKEFARAVAGSFRITAEPVARLTDLFERAKYDRRPLSRRDAEIFFDQSRRVVEALLRTAGAH